MTDESGAACGRHQNCSVAGCGGHHAAFGLRFSQTRRDLFEYRKVLIDIRFAVLHGNGPLLVPPIRLSQHAAIHHGEPIVAPEVDIDLGPIAIIFDFLRIQHERAVDSGAGDISARPAFFTIAR